MDNVCVMIQESYPRILVTFTNHSLLGLVVCVTWTPPWHYITVQLSVGISLLSFTTYGYIRESVKANL